MRLFDSKHDKLIKMLRESKQNFRFDQNQTRFNLLKRLERRDVVTTAPSRLNFRMAVAVACLLLFAGSGITLVFANNAKPGDKLYPLDQLQERVVLKIPLSAETKARLQAKIVAERAAELNKVKALKNRDEIKVEAVVGSKKSLNQAIEQISRNRDRLEHRGKHEAAIRLEQVLIHLEELAEEQEQRAGELKADVTNVELRQKIEENIEAIRETRNEVRLKVRSDSNSGSGQDLELPQ